MAAREPALLLGEPDSPEQRVETSYHSALLTAFAGVAAIFTVAVVAITGESVPGFRPLPLSLLAAAAVTLAVIVRRHPEIISPGRMPFFLAGATVAIGAGVYFVGPVFGGFVSALFLWVGASPAYFRLREAIPVCILLAVVDVAVVLSRPGNTAPAVRAELTVGAAVLYGYAIRAVYARVRSLVETEASARREAEEAQRRLEKVSAQRSEFLARMSHELRTPLNAVIGFSDVLADGLFGHLNDRQSEYVDDIRDSGRHLLGLVDDVLDLSKVEAGRLELTVSPVDVCQVVESSVTLFREQAARHRIRLVVDTDPTLSVIEGDERKIRQVVVNLVSNAMKFTPDGGRVGIRTRRFAAGVELTVSDTGPGIRAEDQDRIFELYEQANGNGGGDHGTGLGLPLSRRLVVLHGGSIGVDSEPGKGASFSVRLPAASPARGTASASGCVDVASVVETSAPWRARHWLAEGVRAFLPGENGERIRQKAALFGDPDSPAQRVTTARIGAVGLIALAGLAVLKVVTVALWPETPPLRGYHPLPVVLLAVVAFVGGILALAAGRRWPSMVVPWGVIAATAGIALSAYCDGPTLAPYSAIFFVWVGVGAAIFLPRSAETLIIAAIGVSYGVVLAIQPGNGLPVIRWTLVMGLVVISAISVGRFVRRIQALADAAADARREAEQVKADLEAASRHKGEFLANMSHELRTPLNAILGFSEVLGQELFGELNPRQSEYVADITSSGAQLLTLVNDVLDLAKCDAGRMELEL
ncbi:MAG: hypothetical protein JOZ04_03950, partial [Acidimicrobiia bacterium]|nr:hypothetical protein [Acidimicrobiia bacterium]